MKKNDLYTTAEAGEIIFREWGLKVLNLLSLEIEDFQSLRKKFPLGGPALVQRPKMHLVHIFVLVWAT